MFRRESPGSADRTNRPTLSLAADGVGTVVNVEYRNEDEVEVFDKPINGRWVDYDVVAVRDRETFTLEVAELSELFWKLLRQTNPTFSGGGATYTPGSHLVTRGWMAIQTEDNGGVPVDLLYRYCHLQIETQSLAKTGLVTARFSGRKLYSNQNYGVFANVV